MTTLTRRGFILGVGATIALPFTGCSATPGIPSLTMGCGERGGSYLEFGELLRDSLHRRQAATVTVLATHGSAENLGLLTDRTADIVIALADTAAMHPHDIVAIGRVYQNYLHCVVRADSPVQVLSDLHSMPISIGATGSGTALTARRVLDVLDLSSGPHAPIVSERALRDAVAALRDDEITAFFWSGGIPTPHISQLSARTPVRLLDVSSALPGLNSSFPNLYVSTSVPPGVYGTTQSTLSIGIPNLLLARPDFDEGIVGTLVDTLIEDARSLVPADSVGVQYLTLSNLIDTSPIPLHPAAERRYRERYG